MAFNNFSRNGAHAQPMVEINTTPLVDVMLVLLVIFIITAPLFHQAVQVDLPRVDSSRLDDKPRVLLLAIDASGGVHLDGVKVERADLEGRFRQAVAADRRAPELHLRADRSARYEQVADVMSAAQRNGIVKLAFVTEPSRSGGVAK